jgi:hypothetical protein
MKTCLLVFLCSLIVLTARSQDFATVYKPGDFLYVHAASGLMLRERPNAQAKSLTVVKLGEKVQVVADTQPPVAFKSAGVPGHWAKVKYNNAIGYQFDGFLSRYPPFKSDNEQEPGESMAVYLKKIFKVKTEQTKSPERPDDYSLWDAIEFENGAHFEVSGGSSYRIDANFPAKIFSFHEAFLLGRDGWPWLSIGEGCLYEEDGILCEAAAPQYLRISRYQGIVTLSWYVSD